MTYRVVTAADAKYFGCLQGLLGSLAAVEAAPVVLDLGLDPVQRDWLGARGVTLERFTYPHAYPARAQVEAAFPGFGAMLARPYLNEVVSGADILVWVDADAWFQDASAVAELVHEASGTGMAAVPEVDRGYFKFVEGFRVWDAEARMYHRCFGSDVARLMRGAPVINSGFWAARTDSPLWAGWRRHLQDGLDRLPVIDDESRIVEQAAFNVTLQAQRLPVRRFPATYNWLVCLAVPAWDPARRLLVDPNPPYDPLRLVHLSTHVIGKGVALPLAGSGLRMDRPVGLEWADVQRLRNDAGRVPARAGERVAS